MSSPSGSAVAESEAAPPVAESRTLISPVMPYPVGRKWKPVTVSNKVVISGGFGGNQVDIVPTMHINIPGKGNQEFIEINKNKPWMLRITTGKQVKGTIKLAKICETMRDRAAAIAAGLDAVENDGGPSAADAAEGPADDDPMSAIDVEAPTVAAPKRKRKRLRQSVTDLEVDVHPPMAKSEGNTTHRVKVVYMQASRKLWMHIDHVEWLLAYIADECICGGVEVPDEGGDAPEVVVGNCNVPGLHIEFNFKQATYEGTFVDGPLRNATVMTSSAADLTEAKWNKLLIAELVTGELSSATTQERNCAAEEFLKFHCRNLVDAALDATASGA